MNKILRFTLLIWWTFLLFACEQGANNSFTITGKLDTVHVPLTDGSDQTSEIDENTVDWSGAKVVVTQEVSNSAGEIETVELAAGTFDNNELTLSGSVDQPTEVKISVETDGADPLTLNAVIAPDANISLMLVEYPAFNSASMEFFGASRKVMNPANGFSISGDLSSIDADLERATLRVTAWEYDNIGEQQTLNYGRVFLDNGQFVIEADVAEPKVVNILVIVPASQQHTQFHAIVEPGAEIEIVAQSTWLYNLTPISGTGKHAQIVESWQQSEEYLEIEQEYRVAYQEYQSKTQNDEDVTDSAEGETPKYRELSKELGRIRNEYLENVAANAEDPMDSLLALELSAYWGKEEALPIFDRLSKSLDKDLVMRRVTHDRNFHAAHLENVGINRSLVVGKQAPEFTLPNLEGEQISLNDLQQKNEFVLVDFWASWCGPCIESIPALKDLYASYHESGFEIVSISVDDHYDAWAEGSDDNELPWVNLGELKGFRGDIATSYGVTFIPKSYLLDNEGQIVQKDLQPKQLEDWLAETYGEITD